RSVTETHAAQPRELPSSWNPADVEAELYQRWVEAGYFTADANSDKPPFSIVIPPPNVTGSLHIGHAYEHTLMDLLIRRRRMQGYETLWLPGMDHASIAVQALVESSCGTRASTTATSAGKPSSSACGSGRRSTAGPSCPRCAAWVTASTGPASASPW